MDNSNLRQIVKSLFVFLPLVKKKLTKWSMENQASDLPTSHYVILFILDENGAMAFSDLVRSLGISKPNVTPMVQALYERGLVERCSNKKDRRYIDVRLTQAGKDFIGKHKQAVESSFLKKISHLSEDDLSRLAASLNDLEAILAKLE